MLTIASAAIHLVAWRPKRFRRESEEHPSLCALMLRFIIGAGWIAWLATGQGGGQLALFGLTFLAIPVTLCLADRRTPDTEGAGLSG